MTDFKVTDEAVEAALFCTPIDADGGEMAMPIDFLKMGTPEQLDKAKMIMRAALEAALPVMFEEAAWLISLPGCPDTPWVTQDARIYEGENRTPLYRLKEPK